MLDPRFRGSDLTGIQKADGLLRTNGTQQTVCFLIKTFEMQSKNDVIDDYMKFKAKCDVFDGKPLIWETITLSTDPLMWWKAFCVEQTAQHKKLSSARHKCHKTPSNPQ